MDEHNYGIQSRGDPPVETFKRGDHVIYTPAGQHGVVRNPNPNMPGFYFVVYDNSVMRMETGLEPYTAQNTCGKDLKREGKNERHERSHDARRDRR